MNASNPSATVLNADAARLSRLDAEIASLESRLAGKVQERDRLAVRWGRGEGYLFPAKPEHMRRHYAALATKETDHAQ